MNRLRRNLLFASIICLSINFVVSGYASDPFNDPQDRDRVELFLKYMLIEEGGIYTLVGSKPMTAFSLAPVIDEREKRELYAAKDENFRKHISLEKFQPTKEDARKLWNDWRKVEDKYLGSPFLIREDDQYGGILINILSVTYILDRYYEEFEKIIREPITAKTFVYRIGEKGDPAWEKIKGNHYLMGLLFGFGEKNARCFSWEESEKKYFPLRRITSFSPVGTGKPVHKLSIEDLDLPGFVSYQLIDEQVERYRMEREKCIELFKDEDFCLLAMSILQGQPPPEQKKVLSEESMRLVRERVKYISGR